MFDQEGAQAAIERKVQGKEVTLAAAEPRAGGSNVVDLLDALKASLAGSAATAKDKGRKPPKRAAAPSAAPKKSSRRSDA